MEIAADMLSRQLADGQFDIYCITRQYQRSPPSNPP